MTTKPTSRSTPPIRTGMSIGRAMLLVMTIGIVYAFLIPDEVLTVNPWLANLVAYVESVFPAIGGYARFSPIPEVVRLYYATMWVSFPILLWWFIKNDFVNSKAAPPTVLGFKLFLAILVFLGFATLVVLLLGFHVPRVNTLKSLATGGRGNALLTGLTANRFSIGFFSTLAFLSLCILIHGALHGITTLLKGNRK